MRFTNKIFLRTLGIVLFLLIIGSITAYYAPQYLKTKEVTITHRETGVKTKPIYLGEFRVSGDYKRLSWANGKLYALAAEEIVVYSPEGKKQKVMPIGVDVEPSGFVAAEDRFYITDAQHQMAYVFNSKGKFWFRFPQRDPDDSRGERKLKVPVSLYRKSGVVYATDGFDNQIKTYNSDGLPIISFSKGQQGRLGDLVVTVDGRLAVFNQGLQKIQIFTCDGRYIYDMDDKVPLKGEALLEIDGLQRFQVLDKGAGQILVYDSMAYYLFSFGDKELQGAEDFTVNSDDRLIYALVPGENRIKVWGY